MRTSTSISNLKRRLGAYLALVGQGEEVLVTDRGRPVARLVPVTRDAAATGRRELLLESGRMIPPRSPLPADFLQRPRPADAFGRSIAVILGDRASS